MNTQDNITDYIMQSLSNGFCGPNTALSATTIAMQMGISKSAIKKWVEENSGFKWEMGLIYVTPKAIEDAQKYEAARRESKKFRKDEVLTVIAKYKIQENICIPNGSRVIFVESYKVDSWVRYNGLQYRIPNAYLK